MIPNPKRLWFHYREMLLSVLAWTVPCGWMALKMMLTNLVWAIVGLIFGASVGNSFAYWTAGQDQGKLRILGEFLVVDTIRGAVVGVFVGYAVGLVFDAVPGSGARRLQVVRFFWGLLVVASFLIYMASPFPAVRE